MAKAKRKTQNAAARAARIGSLDAATDAIKNLEKTIAESFLALGCLYTRIRDEQLFRERYDSFEDYLEQRCSGAIFSVLRLVDATPPSKPTKEPAEAMPAKRKKSKTTSSEARRAGKPEEPVGYDPDAEKARPMTPEASISTFLGLQQLGAQIDLAMKRDPYVRWRRDKGHAS